MSNLRRVTGILALEGVNWVHAQHKKAKPDVIRVTIEKDNEEIKGRVIEFISSTIPLSLTVDIRFLVEVDRVFT